MNTAQDFMIRDVISIDPNASIRELLLLFAKRNVSGVIVTSKDDKLKGMVTVGDVFRHLQPQVNHSIDAITFMTFYTAQNSLPERVQVLLEEPVTKIMTSRQLIFTTVDAPLEEIIEVFAGRRFKKLPVLNTENKVIGVISRGDLLRFIVMEMLTQ